MSKDLITIYNQEGEYSEAKTIAMAFSFFPKQSILENIEKLPNYDFLQQ